jgi:hypothetical protein
MKINVLALYSVCATLLLMPQLSHDSRAEDVANPNIALGKTVTALPLPNSPDSGNKLELLTDGNPQKGPVVSQGSTSLWVQPTAVGWARTPISCLIVDLESVQPISGFAYHTAAGVADVTWPGSIYILVSDDQKTWKYVGDLVTLSAKQGPPPPYGAYHEHTFKSREAQAKGRYVAFGITSSLYTITDEIEVYAGDKSWLAQPDTKSVAFENQPADLLEFLKLLVVKSKTDQRIDTDRNDVKISVEKSALPQARKNELLKQIRVDVAPQSRPVLPGEEFKTILPLDEAHRRILSAHGKLLSEQGFAPLTIWSQQRFDWLDFLATPQKKKAEIDFSMLGNQFRSQALLLTNATGSPQTVKLRLNKSPQKAQQGWLKVDEVLWTDTHSGSPVPDALNPIAEANGAYVITIPAGITRKVWFTVDSSKLASGRYQSTLAVDNGKTTTPVPFSCTVSSITMQRPRLSLGMWDETDVLDLRNSYSLNAKNKAAALKLMQSHYVDTAWGTRAALPWPTADEFDAQGRLKGELDFSRFDNWAKDWPDARYFFVFLNSGDNFAGEQMGTPLFAAKVGSWAQAVTAHMRKVGRDPGQIGLMLVDESHSDASDAIIVAWSKAIKATAPELQLFSDPLWVRPDEAKLQEALTGVDILSPNLAYYQRGGELAKTYYEGLRQQGKQLWFYQCDGPTRLFDPQRYFRYQAWHTFAMGGKGQGFWSFGDAGKSSWNEHAGISFTYAPAFVDQTSVTNSIHWDSVREGITDYEELAMLRDAIGHTKDATLREKAQKTLNEAVLAVTGIWKDVEVGNVNAGVTPRYDWRRPGYDVDLADRELKKVRQMLEKLQ